MLFCYGIQTMAVKKFVSLSPLQRGKDTGKHFFQATRSKKENAMFIFPA
jgi:hypothetical protein